MAIIGSIAYLASAVATSPIEFDDLLNLKMKIESMAIVSTSW